MPYSLEGLFSAAVDSLHDARSKHLLYGGIAAGLWGEPRLTEDVDIVLFVPEREFPRFLRSAAGRGFFVEEDLCVQQIQISGWSRIPLGDKGSPWHVDVTLGDSPFDQSALRRRREVELFGRRVFVASPEDLDWARDIEDEYSIDEASRRRVVQRLSAWSGLPLQLLPLGGPGRAALERQLMSGRSGRPSSSSSLRFLCAGTDSCSGTGGSGSGSSSSGRSSTS